MRESAGSDTKPTVTGKHLSSSAVETFCVSTVRGQQSTERRVQWNFLCIETGRSVASEMEKLVHNC